MSSALDRQIRLVYDALDTGSNKSAILTCNKLLKKNPKHALLKALKALALVRSQKIEESLIVCDEVLETKPTDDGVLSTMMHVLRALNRQNDMVNMFEEAFKQHPTNEELGAQAFFANVRAGRWKSAQQIATRMYKQFQDDRLLYWNVMTAVLQANEPTTPPDMRTILYKLAHRIITSSPTPSYQNSDRFHLHLSILRELKLYDEAHKLLDSDIGKAICLTSLSCNEIRRDIWRLRGMTKEEGDLATSRIVDSKDRNWLEFLSVLDSTFSYTTTTETPDEDCLQHVAKTQELFTRIAEEDGPKDRSAALALLELEKRAHAHGISKDSERLVVLMQDYFTLVGDKACCFEDLKPYLSLDANQMSKWKSFLRDTSSTFSNPQELQRVINSHKLLRHTLTDSELNVEAETARVTIYVEQYLRGLELGKNLPATELQYADDLALLASNTLVNLWQLTSDERHLTSAVTLLEFAQTKSRQSFQFRLLLVRLYHLLGTPTLALEHYRAMGVKQVQNDTLSHFLLSRASTFSLAPVGDITWSSECLESTQIYLSNTQETTDFIVRAFTTEKYSQIPEFINFEDRLENSLQRDIVKLEHLRIRLSHEQQVPTDVIDSELIELKFIFERAHHDNRDFDIISNYQPKVVKDIYAQTELLGKNVSVIAVHKLILTLGQHGWLWTFLKMYIRAFQQCSDLDDVVEEKLLIGDRPKPTFDTNGSSSLQERLVQTSSEELAELTEDEVLLFNFARAMADWLEPYHDYARPPANVVLAEAAKQTELKTGHPLKGVDVEALNRSSSPSKKDEEPPAVTDPPELVSKFFDNLKTRFAEIRTKGILVDILHVATLAQEAFILLAIESHRFKSTAVVKANRFGALVASLKAIRSEAVTVLRDMSVDLVKQSETVATQETRKAFIDACAIVSVQQIDTDFALGVAKKVTEARKKVIEGIGKGLGRVCASYP
ncbi:hypothetical protein H0H92_012950 [Tricholoma furcatifolium]|nr:hypothetical protein H0H92_012950 [Tricholoma furcatifolium]